MNPKKSLSPRAGSREVNPHVQAPRAARARRQVLVVRTDRRSWIMIAITAFGALLLRYLKIVRERGLQLPIQPPKDQRLKTKDH